MESILAKALGQDTIPNSGSEKRDLLQRLLARLAHEVRNPLGSLGVHFQLLEEDLAGLDPEKRALLTPRLEIIRGELHRLERVVDHFLRLAAPSELDLEPVCLADVLAHAVELLRPEAAAREIRIETEIKNMIPPFLADRVKLTQVLLNLIINAMQAIERKGRIRVTLNSDGAVVGVEVRDSGPGLPEDKMAVLFDPFFTTKAEGNGLGLWIAQQLVLAHGGTLQARNAPGGGAEFTMFLPNRGLPDSGGGASGKAGSSRQE